MSVLEVVWCERGSFVSVVAVHRLHEQQMREDGANY